MVTKERRSIGTAMIHLFTVMLAVAVLLPSASAFAADTAEKKALIAYYSRTGNTRMVCSEVHTHVASDLVEIKDLNNRMSRFGIISGMLKTLLGMTTKIEPETVDMSGYELIVIGSPIWASKVRPAIRTFIKRNSLQGKRVVLLATSDSFLAEKYQQKNSRLVRKAGGTVEEFFQVQVMEGEDDSLSARTKEDILADAEAVAQDIGKVLMR